MAMCYAQKITHHTIEQTPDKIHYGLSHNSRDSVFYQHFPQ